MGTRKSRFAKLLISPTIGITACIRFGRLVDSLMYVVLLGFIYRLSVHASMMCEGNVADNMATGMPVGSRALSSPRRAYEG